MKTSGLDVHKDTIFCAIYDGKSYSTVMEFELKLVNPHHIKQKPGRKSDAKDAPWIAELLHKNMLRGSLVPSPLIQKLRTYTREYRNLVNQHTKVLTQMDRVLVMCGIRIYDPVKVEH